MSPIKASRLSIAVRLPLLAATLIFGAAVASTQTAIFVMSRQADRQVETLGQVYLDGLSAALLPHVARGDIGAIHATLSQAMAFHEGIVDRRLTYVPVDGAPVDVLRPGTEAGATLPTPIGSGDPGFLKPGDGTIWVWRPLRQDGVAHGTIAANLDIAEVESERGALRWWLLLLDLGFSGVCAVLGYFMVRRVQQPVAIVAGRLYDAALGMLRPIEPREAGVGDLQTERMILAFNAMANASVEREGLLAHLARQQRDSDLGRLTATIAHEVRNPLGGMRAAVSTLHRFGDREEPRREAVAFLDRGLLALEHVVNATLETYRTRQDWRPLSRRDFEDLRLLVEADGRSHEVEVALSIDLPETVPIAALEVRQVLLNLLLNAIRASATNGRVDLKAAIDANELVVTVRDRGRGLDDRTAHALEAGAPPSEGPGLGVAIVIRLVERLQGRVSIESCSETGTAITLRFPFQPRTAAA